MKLPTSLASEGEHIRRELGEGWIHYGQDLDQLLHLRWLGFHPRCVFDVGSSNTIWSVMAQLVFPGAGFQLFEPLAEMSHAYLVDKRKHPAVCRFLDTAEYRLHPLALGRENGTCRFRWFQGHDAGSTRWPWMATSKAASWSMFRFGDRTLSLEGRAGFHGELYAEGPEPERPRSPSAIPRKDIRRMAKPPRGERPWKVNSPASRSKSCLRHATGMYSRRRNSIEFLKMK